MIRFLIAKALVRDLGPQGVRVLAGDAAALVTVSAMNVDGGWASA